MPTENPRDTNDDSPMFPGLGPDRRRKEGGQSPLKVYDFGVGGAFDDIDGTGPSGLIEVLMDPRAALDNLRRQNELRRKQQELRKIEADSQVEEMKAAAEVRRESVVPRAKELMRTEQANLLDRESAKRTANTMAAVNDLADCYSSESERSAALRDDIREFLLPIQAEIFQAGISDIVSHDLARKHGLIDPRGTDGGPQ